MVSKDQSIGGLIFLVCIIIIIGYVVALFAPQLIGSPEVVRYWLAEIPVLIGVVAVLAIGAWIGWTMATTPPPKPIEEIEAEEEQEEKAAGEEPEKAEEKEK